MSARDFGECADCKFWQRDKQHQQGWCQRYAPRAFDQVGTAFPVTEEGDWCGEFEASK